jgi:hypothetical protein
LTASARHWTAGNSRLSIAGVPSLLALSTTMIRSGGRD